MPRGAFYGGKLFEKGNKFGKGRPKLSPELKMARRMNVEEFSRILNEYINLPIQGLVQKAKDPSTPAFELLVIKILMEAVKHGNLSYFNCIVDRLIGKVPEKHHHSGSLHTAIMSAIASAEKDDENENT